MTKSGMAQMGKRRLNIEGGSATLYFQNLSENVKNRVKSEM